MPPTRPRPTKFIVIGLAAVTAITGCWLAFSTRSRGDGKRPAPDTPPPATTPTHSSQPPQSAAIIVRSQAGQKSPVMFITGDPLRARIAMILQQHPEIRVSAESAERIQEIYTRHTLRRMALEVALADIRKTDTTSLVDIPAYPKDGIALFEEFKRELDEANRSDPTLAALTEIAAQTFAGDNAQLGRNARKLTISRRDDGGYSLNHQILFLNETGDKVTGIGTTQNDIPRLETSPWKEQAAFFP